MKSIHNYILEKLKLSKDSAKRSPKTMNDLYKFIHKQVKENPYSTAIEHLSIADLKPSDDFEDKQTNMVSVIAMRYCILEILKKHYINLYPCKEKYDIYNNMFVLDNDLNVWDEIKVWEKLDFEKISDVTNVTRTNRHPAHSSYLIDIETIFGITFNLKFKTGSRTIGVHILDSKYITKENNKEYDIRSYLEK